MRFIALCSYLAIGTSLLASAVLGQMPCHLGCLHFVVAVDDRTDKFGLLDRYTFRIWGGGTVRGGMPVPTVQPDVAPEKKTCAAMTNVQIIGASGICAPAGLSCQVTKKCEFNIRCDIKMIDTFQHNALPVFVPVGSRSAIMANQDNSVTVQQTTDGARRGAVVNVNKTAEIKCRAGRGWIEVMIVGWAWEAVILRVIVVCSQCPDTTGG